MPRGGARPSAGRPREADKPEAAEMMSVRTSRCRDVSILSFRRCESSAARAELSHNQTALIQLLDDPPQFQEFRFQVSHALQDLPLEVTLLTSPDRQVDRDWAVIG